MHAARRIASDRVVETELAKGHPLLGNIGELRRYNSLRSSETGRAILDGNRVLHFINALETVKKLPTGDYAELGTYRGITANLIWQRRAPGAKLHCFDTFAGFDDRDVSDQRLDVKAELGKFRDTSLELVQNRIAGGPHTELSMHAGYFPSTFDGLENLQFRLVHIDMDLAKPIQDALEVFWPRLVDGGIILIHDYRSARYPMAAETVDAFFTERGVTVWPLPDRLGTAMVIRQRGMTD